MGAMHPTLALDCWAWQQLVAKDHADSDAADLDAAARARLHLGHLQSGHFAMCRGCRSLRGRGLELC
jgi:hypothetical protein